MRAWRAWVIACARGAANPHVVVRKCHDDTKSKLVTYEPPVHPIQVLVSSCRSWRRRQRAGKKRQRKAAIAGAIATTSLGPTITKIIWDQHKISPSESRIPDSPGSIIDQVPFVWQTLREAQAGDASRGSSECHFFLLVFFRNFVLSQPHPTAANMVRIQLRGLNASRGCVALLVGPTFMGSNKRFCCRVFLCTSCRPRRSGNTNSPKSRSGSTLTTLGCKWFFL